MRYAGFNDPFTTLYNLPNEYREEATDDYEREECEREAQAQQRIDEIERSPAFKKLKVDPVLKFRTERATHKLMAKMYNLARSSALPDKFDEFCTHYFYTKHHGLELRVVGTQFDDRILFCVKGTSAHVVSVDDLGHMERGEDDIETTTSSVECGFMQKRVENLKEIIRILKLQCPPPSYLTVVCYLRHYGHAHTAPTE
jgi:hypothetical protein